MRHDKNCAYDSSGGDFPCDCDVATVEKLIKQARKVVEMRDENARLPDNIETRSQLQGLAMYIQHYDAKQARR